MILWELVWGVYRLARAIGKNAYIVDSQESNTLQSFKQSLSKEVEYEDILISKEVAEEMVRGVTKVAGTNVGISVTGIAGPGGGSEKFPVGLVYIGYKINDFVKVIRYVFPGDRSEVRMHAVETALQELDDLLIKEGF